MGTDSTKPSINLARAEDDKLRSKYQAQKAQEAPDEAEHPAGKLVNVTPPADLKPGHKPGSEA